MSSSYHRELKLLIEGSCINNITHWEKVVFAIATSADSCRLLWSVKVLSTFLENKYCLWEINFNFLYVDIQFDVLKCKLILKNSSLKCCLCFREFLWGTQ